MSYVALNATLHCSAQRRERQRKKKEVFCALLCVYEWLHQQSNRTIAVSTIKHQKKFREKTFLVHLFRYLFRFEFCSVTIFIKFFCTFRIDRKWKDEIGDCIGYVALVFGFDCVDWVLQGKHTPFFSSVHFRRPNKASSLNWMDIQENSSLCEKKNDCHIVVCLVKCRKG